ncbi:hypothetical protein ACFQZZ_17565 [Nocardia sp. GCM10030253]|uniref:hypothetical protein n=1 Tax=Nocardia sp. GCM10030253 TaxID=3273404 RepID=UPI0036443F72
MSRWDRVTAAVIVFDASEFYALHTGPASRIGMGAAASAAEIDVMLAIHDAGEFEVLTGKVALCDPGHLAAGSAGSLQDRPVDETVPIFASVPVGRHLVLLTTATEPGDDHCQVLAYLSLVFSDAPTTAITPWIAEGGGSRCGEPANNFLTVDGGVAGLLDAAGADRIPSGFDVVRAIDRALIANKLWANIPLPIAETSETVVACRSGKGAFPVMQSLDAQGNVTGLHVDFAVVGPRSRKAWWKSRHLH